MEQTLAETLVKSVRVSGVGVGRKQNPPHPVFYRRYRSRSASACRKRPISRSKRRDVASAREKGLVHLFNKGLFPLARNFLICQP